MPRRLSVVVCHSAIDPQRQRIEEELIVQLTIEPGIDVNLVPGLADCHEDSTGRLCLEGISGDMVLLGWLPADRAFARLGEMGIDGHHGRTRWDPPAAIPGEPLADRSSVLRSLYWVDLSQAATAADCTEEIRRIRDDVRLRRDVVKPSLPNTAPPPSEGTPPSGGDGSKTARQSGSTPGQAMPLSVPVLRPVSVEHPVQPPSPQPETDPLDRLVDELDALDL